jgi:hypothetical protein
MDWEKITNCAGVSVLALYIAFGPAIYKSDNAACTQFGPLYYESRSKVCGNTAIPLFKFSTDIETETSSFFLGLLK